MQQWYLDSGCSKHITGDKSKFLSIFFKQEGHVTYRDNNKGRILRRRSIGDKDIVIIHDVLYVEGLRHNLLSISQLCDKGYQVIFKTNTCEICLPNTKEVMLVGKRVNNVYLLDISSPCSIGCLLSKQDESWLWHRRIAHIHMNHLNKLISKDLVIGLPKLKFERDHICEACQKGKQVKSSFKTKNVVSSLRPLELLHNFSAPRTPQQNGVVERKNRSLEELARTMLSESSLPKYFWADAVSTSCYVMNRVLIWPILKKTPYELFNGRKPNISHLKVFGCSCFVLNNGKESLGKFDQKADLGVFIGYSLTSHAYRVYNKRLMTIEEPVHVVFDEVDHRINQIQRPVLKKMNRISVWRSWKSVQKNNRLIRRNNRLKFYNMVSCPRSGGFLEICQWIIS